MSIDFTPLIISIKTSLAAVVITFILGIAAARLFMNTNSKVQWLLDFVFTFHLVLPPTVVGFILLVIFGKNSFIGQAMYNLGVFVIFTWQATVIAAVLCHSLLCTGRPRALLNK
jgi:molybdate transport system permease protein